MNDDARVGRVRDLLVEHTKSPSLRHIRDPYALAKLASQIVRTLDRGNPLWTKWTGPREELVAAAALCWVPVQELRDSLNTLEGPKLTTTDVSERLEAIHLEPYNRYPNDELREGCETIFQREKAEGTEIRAIIGTLQRYVEEEGERLRVRREREWKERAQADQLAKEQRFQSGADCNWTTINLSKELFCRINGRTYRLARTDDKRWELSRIEQPNDLNPSLLGRYSSRGEASKALKQIAYKPEFRR